MDPLAAFGDLEDNSPNGAIWAPETAPTSSGGAWNSQSPGQGSSVDDNALGDADKKHVATGTTKAAREGAGASRRTQYRFSIKVTNIEFSKNDPIVWFDVSTSLPRFRARAFKDVRRTYSELRRFANHLANANPECFLPSLPPATTSFPQSSEENLIRLMANFQRWFDRVTTSPLLARDEEFLYFVESSFGYTPVVKVSVPSTGLARKLIKQMQPPEDDVEELRDFRPVVKLVYQYAQEGVAKMKKVSKARRELSTSLQEYGAQLENFGNTPTQRDLTPLWGKLGKTIILTGDMEAVKATMGDALYADALEIVAHDAYIVKETLTNRHFVMRDLLKAQAQSRTKHQNVTKLKGATAISAAKVEEAISQLEDATQLEKRITSTCRRITNNLVAEKKQVITRLETDILTAVQEYAIRIIDVERRLLSSWESIKRNVRAADPDGGLHKLGREPGSVRTAPLVPSQGRGGDSWSDRSARAKDSRSKRTVSNEVLDAKMAAQLLADHGTG